MYKTHLSDQHCSYPYNVIKSLKMRNLFLRCHIGKDKKMEKKKDVQKSVLISKKNERQLKINSEDN